MPLIKPLELNFLKQELKTETLLNKETRKNTFTAAHTSGLSPDPRCTQPYFVKATPRPAVL